MTTDSNTLSPQNQQNVRDTAAESVPRESAGAAQTAFTPYTGAELWLHRVNVLLFVFLCAAMGVLMFIVPWWPQWTDNYFLLGHPALRAWVSGGFGLFFGAAGFLGLNFRPEWLAQLLGT